jgi:hypothetical protein
MEKLKKTLIIIDYFCCLFLLDGDYNKKNELLFIFLFILKISKVPEIRRFFG